ncbi:hypothetical protein [Vibrio gazogenes]|uniref:Uncharacterized protein n=1 Tax=Vibrio gazogenes TaxID=687 RepID=A0A1Z2SL96_VIBGA|nr:hypothetical protein [Vibrio gazogenes]ASA57919.1 hypothetical protein BSQ33_19610 [Vibrio gazogenes]
MMKNLRYVEVGKTFDPKEHKRSVSDDEVIGNYWRVWHDGGKYFYEYDTGHFATKFDVVQISEDDFLLIKSEKLDVESLHRKYT